MLDCSHVHAAQADLATAARYMFWLMFRNVASDGLVFDDPVNAGIISRPGCERNSATRSSPGRRSCAAFRRSPPTPSGSRCPAGCPLLGRYPGDVYDGDTDAQAGDHLWALTTANFAELYYRLAAKILSSRTVPADSLSVPFLAQAGITVTTTTSPRDAAAALRAAGDRMLQAIVFHSDHVELSEQFDADTAFEKSVSSLSWPDAAFLSAVRVRG